MGSVALNGIGLRRCPGGNGFDPTSDQGIFLLLQREEVDHELAAALAQCHRGSGTDVAQSCHIAPVRRRGSPYSSGAG